MKQTAVEWLLQQIKLKYDVDFYHIKNEINQAKEMEKQQIIDAVDGFPIEHRNMLGDEYYEKTFNR